MAAAAETLEIKTPRAQETERSFDPVASINMMRRDIVEHGAILTGTMQRVHDEELSYIAEGIDRHSSTRFSLRRDDDNSLVFFDKGEWRPYIGTLLKGRDVAGQEAAQDLRKTFLFDMAADDLPIGYRMQNLKPGESFAYYSAFPRHVMMRYGKDFLRDCGFQVEREMGFIYRVECWADGSVVLESHTVDNSNEQAFQAAMFEADFNPRATIQDLIHAYDSTLSQITGNVYYAGRHNALANEENAWEFVLQHKPLFDYYFSEISALAHGNLHGDELRRAKERLTIGVWARTKELLDTAAVNPQYLQDYVHVGHSQIALEVQYALFAASQRGDIMAACGGSIKADGLDDIDMAATFEAIFNDKKDDDTDMYGSMTFECPKGHKNRRPVRNQLIDKCQDSNCKVSVRC